uniref:Rho GTPase-activating protein 15 (Trinotate prediction) n=1 Tax=Henneguya salminicola TaxID=69463 RepID=A0A6G3MGA8_HENSL
MNNLVYYNLNLGNTPSHVKLFGGNLQDIYQSYGNKLPQFFEQFLINIEKNGLNISGIYRESGNNDMTKKLKDLIEKRQDFDLNEYHIHVQTSIVKLFLRELRRKIFPQNILSQFYGIKANSDRIECVINAISCLDSSCKSVLYRLVRHFTMINDHSANNLMDFYNISVVFGPTLIECDVLEMLKSVDLIKFILLNHDDIFKEQFYNYLEKPIEISELKFIDECRNSNQNDILSDARKSIISTPEIYISSTNKLIRTYTDDIKLTRVSDSTPHSVLQRLNKTSGDARNKKFFNIVAGPSNTFSIVPNR